MQRLVGWRLWFTLGALSLALAVVGIVRWKMRRDRAWRDRIELLPIECRPESPVASNPFGTDAEVLASIAPEHLASLKNTTDMQCRLITARGYAADGRFTGRDSEIEPFFQFLETIPPLPKPSKRRLDFERSVAATFCLGRLAQAWARAGPLSPSAASRMEAAAVRWGADQDQGNRVVSLALLRQLSRERSGHTLTAEAEKIMRELASDSYVDFHAEACLKELDSIRQSSGHAPGR